MIRQPTPRLVLYAWHRAALRGERLPVHEGLPECGWFRTRLVRLGPWCPASIWVEQEIDPATGELTEPEAYRCLVDGERRSPVTAWISLASNPISKADYDALVALRASNPRMAATMVPFDLTAEPTRPR